MTDDSTTTAVAQRAGWYRGRPRSWPWFLLVTAVCSPLQGGVFLWWLHPPRTIGGWLAAFLIPWTMAMFLALFRNPLTENPYALRLAARTDSSASGVRVMYLLGVFLASAAVIVAVATVIAMLVDLMFRS